MLWRFVTTRRGRCRPRRDASNCALSQFARAGRYTGPEEAMQAKPTLEDTLTLMRDLRARCEWDAAQTHESLRPYLIEEAYEVDDAIRGGDDAKERGAFGLHDVAESFLVKMKGRHPHLYGEGVRQPWEQMKAKRRASIVDG